MATPMHYGPQVHPLKPHYAPPRRICPAAPTASLTHRQHALAIPLLAKTLHPFTNTPMLPLPTVTRLSHCMRTTDTRECRSFAGLHCDMVKSYARACNRTSRVCSHVKRPLLGGLGCRQRASEGYTTGRAGEADPGHVNTNELHGI